MKNNLSELEKKLNIVFMDKNLLKTAFMHRSYLNEHKKTKYESNEKLEFLGDSVLSLITSSYLFRKYPNYSEGEYTDIKASLVRTDALADAAQKLNLGDYTFLSKGESNSGGRKNKNILADGFEALLGAIFLEKGFNKAYKFTLDYLIEDKLGEILNKKLYYSSKSKLQEIMQRKYKTTPDYKLVKESGPEHKRVFNIAINFRGKKLSEGVGMTKKQAEEQAAKRALKKLKK
ncbi:ribonuclease III [Candidatus Roizmanbacteria bacterium RIFCSPHIGHO2_12_FULL_33_9]|uniref:Ribonuclease 3 n=1 Tax=Candidatus Roizmanbacteria bacterium RIFCSPHIGHO2_12_FULL_33_9 TaxID=1802045 RepID=A0A1F7HIH7_9BACT|nr:MAG: ribonuclease III [Candidatus Roizmanbacteria bacterium RIFCSPHIGHO2_12_FULL_33_9]